MSWGKVKATKTYHGIKFYVCSMRPKSWFVECEFAKEGNLVLAMFEDWNKAMQLLNNEDALFQKMTYNNYVIAYNHIARKEVVAC